jgi:hypothetical protein
VEELDELISHFGSKKNHLFHGAYDAGFMLYSSLQRTWKLKAWFKRPIDYPQAAGITNTLISSTVARAKRPTPISIAEANSV